MVCVEWSRPCPVTKDANGRWGKVDLSSGRTGSSGEPGGTWWKKVCPTQQVGARGSRCFQGPHPAGHMDGTLSIITSAIDRSHASPRKLQAV